MANWKSKAVGQVVAGNSTPGCLAGPVAAGKRMLEKGVDSEAHALAREALLRGDIQAALLLAQDETLWAFYVVSVCNWFEKRWMRSISAAVKGLGATASTPADNHYQQLVRQIHDHFATQTARLLAIQPRPKLSVCVIAKNEERSLERCLTSVKAVADEIVVIDTGSTDATVAIAERAGARIGHFEWTDDFAAARNAALELATGDWALSIDADEWLDASSVMPIRVTMSDRSCRFLPIVQNVGGGRTYANTRLFPREGARWSGRMHEDIAYVGQDIETVHLSALKLYHDGRDPSVVDVAAKAARNRRVLAAMAEAGEESPEVLQMYEALIAAAAEPETDETIDKLTAAAKAVAPMRSGMSRLVFMVLSQNLVQRERFEEALEIATLAEEHRLHGLWSYYLRSRYAFMRGDHEEAHRNAKLGLASFDDEGPVDRFRADLTTILEATK